MSGVEVAGIALGCMPLIVSAIDAYINFMKDWGKQTAELRSLNRQLTTERAKLYNVCDLVLRGMVGQQHIEPMLKEPMGPLWRAKETNDKIRRMLWNAYGPFEDTVVEIREALDDLMERLRVQVTPDGQAKWVTKALMTREFKKFLYRLDRKDYHDTLATISKGISDLEDLARLSIRLEPDRRSRSGGRVLSLLRDLSASIYRALVSSIRCNDSHHISLALTARPIAVGYEDEDDKVLQEAQFTVAVSFEVADGPAKSMKRFWDEMSIKPATQPSVYSTHTSAKTITATTTATATAAMTTSALSVTYIEKKLKKAKKGVAFAIQPLSLISSPKPPPLPPHGLVVPIISKQTKPTVVDPDATTAIPLLDLCKALERAREARPPCYGYLADYDAADRACYRHFRVYPHGTSIANSDTWSIVTLRGILEQKTASGGPASPQQPFLPFLKDKIRLGLAVATSVLQLSKTPWLPSVPTSSNVHFFQRGHILGHQHPFLLRTSPDHHHHKCPLSQPPQKDNSEVVYVDRNPTLFALGILLLEILLGATLDQLRLPHEAALSFAGDDLGMIRDSKTASRLLEQRVASQSTSYKNVVERCMEYTAEQDLEDESFRQEVYSGVVAELEKLLDYDKKL